MEDPTLNPVPTNKTEISRKIRDAPPAHYLLKIESFSQLSEILKKTELDKYESDEFESGGYNWKLVLYPYGNAKRDGSHHISLYIAIANENAIPVGSQVDVILKFFVYDQIHDKYLTIQDDRMIRYHSLKTEDGFDKLISLEMFKDSSNGYLVDDCCVFGAEVHVIKYNGKVEKFSVIKDPKDGTFTWEIEKFSTFQQKLWSKEFTVAQQKWKLSLHPKGDSRASGKYLSLFLLLDANKNACPRRRVYTEFKLMVKDQVQESEEVLTVNHWFSNSIPSMGSSRFMLLNDLKNASKGFLVNDTLIVEVEITLVSVVSS